MADITTQEAKFGDSDNTLLLKIATAEQNAAAGVPPSGAAGGDLAGTYPNPTVAAARFASPGAIGGTTPAAITGTTITGTVLVVPSLVPGANFVITQNAVAAFTSVEASAAANTLTMAAGNVAIGELAVGGTTKFKVLTSGAGTAVRAETGTTGQLFSAGGTGGVSVDAPGIASGRWVMLNGGEVAYGVTTPATAVRLTTQGLAAATNDIQRWTAYTGTGTAGATLAFVSGAGTITALVTTVAALPTAAAGYTGARAFVTDANATTFASIVAAGGANGVPVYCDGTNWRIG